MGKKPKAYGMKPTTVGKTAREPMKAKPMMKNVSKTISTPNGNLRSFASKVVR
jgi:hypothetical protein